jgi:hypothetical protein
LQRQFAVDLAHAARADGVGDDHHLEAMAAQPERGLHHAHVRLHAGDDDLLSSAGAHELDEAGMIGGAEVRLLEDLAGGEAAAQRFDHRPDLTRAVLGEQLRDAEQRRSVEQGSVRPISCS